MKRNASRIVTLTTDFGVNSPYVAELKGSLLSVAPQATIVDVTHGIAPQDIAQGAWTLQQIRGAFPVGTIHVAVVDPGVGTDRDLLLVRSQHQCFIGPDNGLFTMIFDDADEIRKIDNPKFWRSQVSHTFHGRDIMAPVAAHLANGVEPARLATSRTGEPVRCSLATPTIEGSLIRGQVVQIDTFGNLITNIHAESLAGGTGMRIEILGHSLRLMATYAEAASADPVAIVGSSGWLEVAIFQGNAEKTLRAHRGEEVIVRLG